jgi:hypothetical protein
MWGQPPRLSAKRSFAGFPRVTPVSSVVKTLNFSIS